MNDKNNLKDAVLFSNTHPNFYIDKDNYFRYKTKNANVYLFFRPYILDELMTNVLHTIANASFSKGCEIAFMPDSHPTTSCMVGCTIALKDKVDVNYVSADIGCGVSYLKLTKRLNINDFKKIDEALRLNNVDQLYQLEPIVFFNEYEKLKCFKNVNPKFANCGLGTVGQGNHFIEIDEDEDKNQYLVVHSGSRNLGGQVHKFYETKQKVNKQRNSKEFLKDDLKKIVDDLKAKKQYDKIENAIKKFRQEHANIDFNYIEGQDFKDYCHDLQIVSNYAKLNRKTIMKIVLESVGLEEDIKNLDTPLLKTSIHNIIGTDLVLRKGAIEAKKGDEVIVPINMSNGCLIGTSLGLEHWNNSCPHGSGRIYSRTKTKANFTLDEFKEATKNIYSTSINMDTLDESPMAYKSKEEIIENTKNLKVTKTLNAVYNFKTATVDPIWIIEKRHKKEKEQQEKQEETKEEKTPIKIRKR